MKLPSGPGAPAPDAADALTDATAACRTVSAISADLSASGTVDGQRLRGHLLVGLAAPASARLEAVAPAGQPLFIFVAVGNDATLLLPREDRVVEHGAPAAVLEAVTGVPVDAVELRETLTGCVRSAAGSGGQSRGADWRVLSLGSTDVYLHREATLARWQLVAAVRRSPAADSRLEPGQGTSPESAPVSARGAWRAEYRDFQGGLPRAIHLASADGKRFNLNLTLAQVALNETLGPEVFRVEIPRSAERISVDDLRHARPGFRQD
jgi:hypothetical protein